MPYDNRDEKTNRFRPSYEDGEFLDAIRELDSPTTGDVARDVGCTREAARYRLQQLEERGEVEHAAIGTAHVWSVTTDDDY